MTDRWRWDGDRAVSAAVLSLGVTFVALIVGGRAADDFALTWFSWGPADVVGSAGWLQLAVAGAVGVIAGLRRA